jgi:2,3-dihydroxybiphenyl 1,2-dioxygenase
MVSVRALGYVGIEASGLDAWANFAPGIVGLEIGSRGADGTLFLRMDERHHRIAIHPGPADDLAYNGWEVASAAELAAIGEQLRACGTPFETGDAALAAARAVEGLIWCLDPNGIRTEIFHGAHAATSPFVSPRAISGFVTGDQGVGHAVLTVDDPEATLAFYRDALGFRISDFIGFEAQPGLTLNMTFMHCNPRHHSLAFMKRPGAPRRLSHLMLEVGDLDDVGATFSLCEREGVPIGMTLGRHTNDWMFSFYMVAPSGFMIEYGYGGRIVDDATWQVERYDSASIWGHRRLVAPAPVSPASPQPERLLR